MTDDTVVAPSLCQNFDSCKLWTIDSLEHFVDPLNNPGGHANLNLPWMEPDDIQIILSAAGEHLALRGSTDKTASLDFNSHARFLTSRTPTGWVSELAIPWSDLGIAPEASTLIGFSLAHNDKDALTRTSLQWMGQGRSFQNAAGWPRILLAPASPSPNHAPSQSQMLPPQTELDLGTPSFPQFLPYVIGVQP